MLLHLLLLVAAAELAVNRLAVPTLQPRGQPPMWHEVLSYAGLFLLYFASTLAVGNLAGHGWQLVTGDQRRRGPRAIPSALLAASIIAFAALAVTNLARDPGEQMSFAFDTAFTLFLLLLLAHYLSEPGDLRVKAALVVLIAPLVIHYYAPFRLMFVDSPEARWGDLPLIMQDRGKWATVAAAILSPYLLCPLPVTRNVVRPAPMAVAMFVAVVGAVILRQHYDVGRELAMKGMGIEIHAGEPVGYIALYVVALGSVTWTLVACVTATSAARRDIGLGLGLILVGGYGFDWPLQYLAGAVGLLTIGGAARTVASEERSVVPQPPRGPRGFRPPPVSAEVWQRWTAALVEALRADDPDCRPSTVTVGGEGTVQTSHVVMTRGGVTVQLRIHRVNDGLVCLDVLCGRPPPAGVEPAWTLYARPERMLGGTAHEEPPETRAPVVRTGDAPFDNRFRVRDRVEHTAALLDEGLRARATAVLDGWMAYWPGHGLQYRVNPGRGAPLDNPIPVTHLSFRGHDELPGMERPIALIHLLAEIGARAGLAGAADAEPDLLGDESGQE